MLIRDMLVKGAAGITGGSFEYYLKGLAFEWSIIMSDNTPPLFDEKLQSTEIRALKAVIPYMEPSAGKMAAIMVKLYELKMIIDGFESVVAVRTAEQDRAEKILSALRESCGEESEETVELMRKVLEMRKMAEVFSAISANDRREE